MGLTRINEDRVELRISRQTGTC